jgi:hypothetical protein
MASAEMFRCVALERINVSEELSSSIIRVTIICEQGTQPKLATDARCEEVSLKEPHGVTSQQTPFFIVTAMKTPNLT